MAPEAGPARPPAAATPGSDRLVSVFLLGLFLAGAAIVWVMVSELVADRRMAAAEARIEAEVTGTRTVTSRRRGESLEVRYRFEVGGRSYTHGDATGRTDLWVSLTPSGYEQARSTGRVVVAYAAADPSVNRPVDYAGSPLSEQLIGGCVGLFCMLPTLLSAWHALRARLARSAATEGVSAP